MTTPTQTKPETIRLTIPVSAEVHEAFGRISKATGMPIGRAMAEWLSDTLDASQYLAETLEKAREAPRLVAQQLHAYALGAADEAGALLEQIRRDPATRGVRGRAQTGLAPFGGSVPPSCNTGGKVPSKPSKPRGGKSS